MRFEEWWMEQEYDPQLYGLLSEVWNAAQAEQREADAKLFGETDALWLASDVSYAIRSQK
jgi:hypothetical protein